MHRAAPSSLRVVYALALLAWAIQPPAAAQPAPIRGDAVGSMGWDSERPDVDSRWDHWLHAFTAGAEVGFYWTEHLRTAVDLAWTAEGQLDVYRAVAAPQAPWAEIYTDLRISHTQVGIGQQYQFFSNTWVHPFVGGGLVLDLERTRSFTPYQRAPSTSTAGGSLLGGGVLAEESRAGPDSRLHVRPLLCGGAKFYFTQRAFFRADLRWAGRDTTRLSTRFGFGVDW